MQHEEAEQAKFRRPEVNRLAVADDAIGREIMTMSANCKCSCEVSLLVRRITVRIRATSSAGLNGFVT